MNLVNFQYKDYALKITWLQMLNEDTEHAKLVYIQLCPTLGPEIWKANIKQEDVTKVFQINCFWVDVLKAWSVYNFEPIVHKDEIVHQMLWYNSHVRCQNAPFLVKKAYINGLTTISCLITPCGEQISPEVICNLYEIDVLTYNTIWAAIPKEWKKTFLKESIVNEGPPETKYETIICKKNISQFIYGKLIAKEDLVFNVYAKWQSKLHTTCSYHEFCKLFTNIYKITNHSKYRSFQYRMLHNALIFNNKLKIWGIKDEDKCTYCEEQENLLHFYTQCGLAKKFWSDIEVFCNNNYKTKFTLTPEKIIFNNVEKDPRHVVNFIVFVAKSFMYSKRCLNTKYTVIEFESLIKDCRNSEYFYAKKANKTSKHYKKWHGNVQQTQADNVNPDEYAHIYMIDMLLEN